MTGDELRQNSLVSYLMPRDTAFGSSDVDVISFFYPDNQGIVNATDCSNVGDTSKRRCSTVIKGVKRSNFYIVLRSLYRPVNVTISGVDAGGSAVRFKDAQIMVDSTGKANDVLRRLQVRVPSTSQFSYPGFVLQTKDSICKLFEVKKDDAGTGTAAQTSASPDCAITP